MTPPVSLDRRHRRRQETIEEVLDVAVDVMAEQGVAGLTLGEVARRMGIRPPSLYVYFDGKNALYDALFERGWRTLQAAMLAVYERFDGTDPVREVHVFARAFVRWAVEHPAYAPLMFWRPVPGFAPSEQAYAPAVALWETGRQRMADLRAAGVLRPDVDLRRAYRAWTAVTSGVITQQLANAPGEPFETGAFTSVLGDVVDMWLGQYGAAASPAIRPIT